MTEIATSPISKQKFLPLLRQPFPWYKELLLTINAVLITPMYSMLLCLLLYIAMIYIAPTLWLRTLLLLYIPYLVCDRTPAQGGRTNVWRNTLRSWPCYKWFADYFDMQLVKTTDLDSSNQYIFLYHPHGVIGLGCNAALNTDGCNFHQVFPGIERSAVTLNETFWTPFLREWIMLLGFVSANKSSLKLTLTKESIILVPGGAAEALHAHPGVMKLYLKNRKGFVRLALETKCPLVPCIGFGENEIFDTLYNAHESSSSSSSSSVSATLWEIQWRLVKMLKFSTPVLTKFIPRPTKVTVVVGEPLPFDFKHDNWDDSTVDQCHSLYLNHLKQLYDTHKGSYGYAKVDMEFI